MKSKLFSIGSSDIVKGLAVTVISMVLTMAGKSIDAGVFPTTWADWKVILLASVGAGVSYLLKNFLTNSNDQLLKKDA
jgi:hypothetical protein